MADSQKYEVYGNPTLQQGGWTRTGDDNDYADYLPEGSTSYYYRICTLDYIPLHHPTQITITGIASKELEVSVLVLRSDNYIISAFGWQDNGYTFNLGSTYDKVGVMFRFKNGDTISPNEVTFDEVGAWVHSLRKLGTATEAVENTLYSDGTPITSYTIKGNTVQNDTPTPSNPVDVNGVGVMTENLFDTREQRLSSFINSTGNVVSDVTSVGWISSGFIEVTAGAQYTFNPNSTEGLTAKHFFYDANKIGISGSAISSGKRTFIVPAGAKYAKFSYRDTSENIMLSTGSTAKSYEPYGYKIPISSGGVTTNIYLGSTQTVRQIKKYEMTGRENIGYSSQYKRFNVAVAGDSFFLNNRETPLLSSHYQIIDDGRSIDLVPNNSLYLGGTQQDHKIYIHTDAYATAIEYEAWLAEQYANGTPVTIWYILATAETTAVNEPLMKIGTYADTLSNATAIPTTEGANSITVDTTVQPSEFTATWTGWHDASVKEKSENLFDDHNVINIPGIGERYATILPNGTYSIYNGTDNSVYYGVNNWIGRFVACEPHSTATITITTNPGTVSGVFMPLNSASQGGCTVIEGSTPPSSYIPYWK